MLYSDGGRLGTDSILANVWGLASGRTLRSTDITLNEKFNKNFYKKDRKKLWYNNRLVQSVDIILFHKSQYAFNKYTIQKQD